MAGRGRLTDQPELIGAAEGQRGATLEPVDAAIGVGRGKRKGLRGQILVGDDVGEAGRPHGADDRRRVVALIAPPASRDAQGKVIGIREVAAGLLQQARPLVEP